MGCGSGCCVSGRFCTARVVCISRRRADVGLVRDMVAVCRIDRIDDRVKEFVKSEVDFLSYFLW
jgi:hypothetical protein